MSDIQPQGEALPLILVVDDDPTLRVMLRRALEKDGNRVLEAEDGVQALQLFEEYQPAVVLLDAVMPKMDGFETCRRLRALEAGDKALVLMVTSLGDDDSINRAFEVGAADFIAKPINWTVLRGRVTHLLRAKLGEEQMRRAEEQLRQARKMEAVGNLTSGIAHDFNNILASIMGYTELLQESFSGQAESREVRYLGEVHKSAMRARDLISQMQVFSRRGDSEPQLLAARPLVDETIKMLRPTLPSTIELYQHFDEQLPQLKIDPVQFQQVVMNLLINARDAMEGVGELHISLKISRLQGAHCASCHQPVEGSYVELSVRDSGSGISDEVQKKLFEPYFTTKPVGRGTGMGLPVVHGIVHEHGGHIVVESQPGEGSVFRLFFPGVMGPAVVATVSKVAEKVKSARNGHGRVLVVDDEQAITGFLAELLGSNGYEVLTCNDAQSALTQFLADPAAIDLMVTDQTLPKMTGVELSKAVLQLRPELPIILCSGYIDETTEQAIKETGISKFFTKPVNAMELLEQLAELLP